MLLVFSTSANASNQIKREVECAAKAGVTIVPLRIENISPTESFQYFLGNIHWLDALTPPLEKHLQEVAAKVIAILSTESVSSSEASQPSSLAHAPTVQQPARRNVLPVIGGIIAVLSVTSVLLFVWQRGTTAPPAAVQSASISGTVASSSVSPVSVVPTPPPVVPPAAVLNMGSNGQQIAVPLPQGTKNVHVRGLNQHNAMAEWKGDPQNWGGVGSSKPWFGAFTNNWWFKGDVKISYTDSAGKTKGWDSPSVPESQPNDVWTTTPDNHNGYEGYPLGKARFSFACFEA